MVNLVQYISESDLASGVFSVPLGLPAGLYHFQACLSVSGFAQDVSDVTAVSLGANFGHISVAVSVPEYGVAPTLGMLAQPASGVLEVTSAKPQLVFTGMPGAGTFSAMFCLSARRL